jgi:ABC-type nitrate/sulfonate/bicarbonate transport system permease component
MVREIQIGGTERAIRGVAVVGASGRLDHIASSKAIWANAFTLAILGGWAVASWSMPPYLLPGPWLVAQDAALFFYDPIYILHMLNTLMHVTVSVLFSFAIAAVLAALGLYVPRTRLLLEGRIYPFLNSFTAIGWTMLAVIWFGVGHFTVIFTITTVLVPFIFVNLREGLAALDRELGEMAESFSRDQYRQFQLIILPSIYPFVFVALRVAFGLGWKVTLLAELFGVDRGFGFVVDQARQNIDTTMIFAVMVLMILIVVVTDRYLFGPLHRLVTRHYAHG